MHLWDSLTSGSSHGALYAWAGRRYEKVTWRAIVQDAHTMAGALRGAGVRDGVPVAAVLTNSPHTVRGLLAIWLAGGGELPAAVDVAIIGAGFAGIGMAIGLVRAGRRDFVILEKASGIGGTWRDNCYPGCSCDTPSALYSYSFPPAPDWTRRYAPRGEIWSYLRDCVRAYDLERHIRGDAAMVSAAFDEAGARWRVVTRRGEVRARVLVAAMGALSAPALPRIPGTGHGSAIFMIETQARYIVRCLGLMDRRGAATIEVTARAQAEYNRELRRRLGASVWETGGCRSWYLDAGGANRALWPGYSWQYRRRMRRPDPEAFVFGTTMPSTTPPPTTARS
ncbi:NAD(P)-binding domain-containing protein [Spirillospora sp. NPDC048911]|uniref:flavin-containing monooxygenase n=1 Tax=Spirillospora sp. NPDC048911 TaxID=3364527 RepID=UPI00371443B0